MFLIPQFILFLLPFILVFNFKDKKKGFLYIFTYYTLYIIISSVFLQALHTFSFRNIFILQILIDLVAVTYFLKHELHFPNKDDFKKLFDKQNSLIVAIFITSFIYLLLPNIHFKGGYNDAVTYKFDEKTNALSFDRVIKNEEEGKYYPYPSYSDEWVAFGKIRNIIEDKSLPFKNYLKGDAFSFEPLATYFSYLSYIYLYFNLSLEQFFLIGKFFNFFLILSFFFLFRSIKISKFASVTASIISLFIMNTQIVTGLWMFIPFNMGALFFFVSLIAFINNFKNISLVLSSISILFYPPMLFPVIVWNLINLNKFTQDKKIKKIIYSFVLAAIVFFTLKAIPNFYPNIINKFIENFIRPTAYGMPENQNLWNLYNFIFIPIILAGAFLSYKNHRDIFNFFVFLNLFWLYYYINQTIIFIDLPRLIMLYCWFALIFIAISIDSFFVKYKYNTDNKVYLFVTVLIILILCAGSYTQMFANNYLKKGQPSPILNTYYKQADIDVFKDFKDKNFLADEWKSLIIASVVGNIPMNSKGSYINTKVVSFTKFMNSSCDEKNKLSNQFKIDLIYGPRFSCANFVLIKKGSDDNLLYKFTGKK